MMPEVKVESLRDNPNYIKCPRCWHHHACKMNFMEMCDRCCQTLLSVFSNDDWKEDFPEVTEDEARRYVDGIKQAYAAQRERFGGNDAIRKK